MNPHRWTISLFMSKGTDCTKLAPIITLAPGTTITHQVAPGAIIISVVPGAVYDFTKEVYWRLTTSDGSTVLYDIFAYER